ncbi:MAG: penicillin-binding protein family [Rhodospirillales bacterium]|nr:penicillin-binding protein family [Rhodospirillales bacterium]
MIEEDESGSYESHPIQRHARRWSGWRFIGKWLIVAVIWGVAGLGILLAIYASDLPDVHQVAGLKKRPGVTLLAADGSVLTQSGDLYGNTLAVSELPPNLVHAVVAIEDRRFYHHFGVDPIGLLRAFITNSRRGYAVQGGSSLTQQLAKNMFLTPERTFKRKLQEALLALQLERYYTKDQILTGYLNRVYLGAGAFGIDAAAKTYFGKPATQLNLQESAIIAGLLKAPSRYSPATDMDAALARAELVLRAMHNEGYISDQDMLAALSAGAPDMHPPSISKNAHYIADWAVQQAQGYIGAIDRDVVVLTTIDPRLQRLAEIKIDDTLSGPAVKLKASQGALVAMTLDGAVRAMVGGRDYAESQFNRATQGERQPGSAFKPFVYLAALENGLRPDSLVDDAPLRIGTWSPENFEPGFKGQIPAREALAESINTAAVRVLDFAGIDHTRSLARRLGIGEPIPRDLSIALGTSDVTLLELTGAYAAFANGGTGVLPHTIERVTDNSGKVLYQRHGGGPGQVAKPEQVAELNSMMMDVIAYGTGKAARLDRPAAGKTGTSQDYRNAWFIGFTADLVTGVWFGNDDNSPMKKVTGGTLPAHTWHEFMMAANANLPPRDLPALAHLPSIPMAEIEPQSPAEQPTATAPQGQEEDGLIGRLLKSIAGG